MDTYLISLKLASLIAHPRRFLSEHSWIASSRFSIKKGNQLKSDHTIIRKSRIFIKGNNNVIELKKADIFNSTIHIAGSNNIIRIHDAVRLYNMNITIKKAQGCSIEIGETSHLGGGTAVCAGNGNYIHIGKNCMIAEDAEIWSSDTHFITINGEDLTNSKPILIKDHVWLGLAASTSPLSAPVYICSPSESSARP